jgi:hypothetical protein
LIASEERRHGEAQHERTHGQADFRKAHSKRGASRRERRQIDIDAGIRYGREKAEQQPEGKGGWLNLRGLSFRIFWISL